MATKDTMLKVRMESQMKAKAHQWAELNDTTLSEEVRKLAARMAKRMDKAEKEKAND